MESAASEITVEFASTPAVVLHPRLVEHWARLLAAAGIDDPASPVTTQDRRWSPMDGTLPPNCPFVDEWRTAQRVGTIELELSTSVPHWSESEPSDAFVVLTVHMPGVPTVAVWAGAGQVPGSVDRWCTAGPVTEVQARLLAALVAVAG